MPKHVYLWGFACRVERAVCDHCIFRHRGCPRILVMDGDLLLQKVGLGPQPPLYPGFTAKYLQ